MDEWGERPGGAPLSGLLGVALLAGICLAFHGLSDGQWVPLLDHANLALHEAGHPLVGLFSERLAVYGGTWFQLLFPLAVAWHFARQQHQVGVAASVVWLGENLLNIARYVADARAQELPLVGGGDHDWTEILGRWGILHLDGLVAGLLRVIGVVMVIAAVGWQWRQYWLERG